MSLRHLIFGPTRREREEAATIQLMLATLDVCKAMIELRGALALAASCRGEDAPRGDGASGKAGFGPPPETAEGRS